MKGIIKKLQIGYVAILTIGLLLALLAPSDYLENDPSLLYWINLYSIVTGLGGMFLTLRIFAFNNIRKAVRNEDEQLGLNAFCKWTTIRLAILALALWSNVVLFLASSYTTTPKYCMLIILVAFVFCWPSHKEFQSIRRD